MKWGHVLHLISRTKSRERYGTISYLPLFTVNPDRKLIRPTRDPPPAPDISHINQTIDLSIPEKPQTTDS